MASLPFVTCRAHTRHSAASTIAASCVCQTHQLHRYQKRHPRRSMLLRPHARQRWLANCRSRAGSSLVQLAGSVGGREKRNRACAWLGLIPNSFPATTRQVPVAAHYYRGVQGQLRMDGIHTTEQRHLASLGLWWVADVAAASKSILSRLFLLLYSFSVFHVFSTVTALFTLLHHITYTHCSIT